MSRLKNWGINFAWRNEADQDKEWKVGKDIIVGETNKGEAGGVTLRCLSELMAASFG